MFYKELQITGEEQSGLYATEGLFIPVIILFSLLFFDYVEVPKILRGVWLTKLYCLDLA